MFGYLKGELTEINTDHIILEVQGIGYQIYLPLGSIANLPVIGSTLQIFTHLHIREDLIMIFGFLSKDDKEMFEMLITVNGIGPKGGLAILSTLEPDDLRFAILSGDSKSIAKSPGIGAKTAQRVILDLKDKIHLEDAFEKKMEHNDAATSAVSSVKNDAILALTALGYTSTESMKAVSKVKISEDMDVEDVIKAAFKHLANFS